MEVTEETKIVLITPTNGRKKAALADLKPGMHVRFTGHWGWRGMNFVTEIRVLPE
jgi:hypothetical protein